MGFQEKPQNIDGLEQFKDSAKYRNGKLGKAHQHSERLVQQRQNDCHGKNEAKLWKPHERPPHRTRQINFRLQRVAKKCWENTSVHSINIKNKVKAKFTQVMIFFVIINYWFNKECFKNILPHFFACIYKNRAYFPK